MINFREIVRAGDDVISMDHRKQNPLAAVGADATLDSFGMGRSPDLSPDEISPRVALVEGSGPGLSGETRLLLRTRLRAAALVLCLGSLAFLIRDLLTKDMVFADPSLRAGRELSSIGSMSFTSCVWRW